VKLGAIARLRCGWFVLHAELRRRWLAVCPRDEADYASFEVLEQRTFAFEALLKRQRIGLASNGIEVERGSALEAACLVAVDLNYQHKAGAPSDPCEDLRPALRVVVGLRQLIEMILRAEKHREFSELVPHLHLLNKGSAPQNVPAPPTDQASNKLLELLIALAALRDGTDLDLDDPNHSAGGKHPDVIVSMPDGRRWGFECKVVHGDASMSLFELIERGIKQIDAAPVDIGMVVLNFKNRLPHDQLFSIVGRDTNGEPVYGAPRSKKEVMQSLYQFGEGRLRAMATHVSYSVVVKAFEGSKALPGVLVVCEAGVPLNTPRGPAASLVGITHLIHLEAPEAKSRFTPSVNAVFRSLNDAMHLR
jgi:hypothetical protein